MTARSKLQSGPDGSKLCEQLDQIRELLDHDHLFLLAIENINNLSVEVFDHIDRATEKGQMQHHDHGRIGAAAGGAACEAIRALLAVRNGLQAIDNEVAEVSKQYAPVPASKGGAV